MKFENPEVEKKYKEIFRLSEIYQDRKDGLNSTKEELLELGLELQRIARNRLNINNVIEETADVIICIRWFLDTFLSDISDINIEDIINKKLDKWEDSILKKKDF